jgi:hypothetical protein
MTIQQTVEIPADHRLIIDVPQEIPAGKATILLFSGASGDTVAAEKAPDRWANPLPGLAKDSNKAEPESGLDVPAGQRKIPDDLAELFHEAAQRAERERTDQAYRDEIAEIYRKCQEGGPILGGIDGMEFQRMMRDEWSD